MSQIKLLHSGGNGVIIAAPDNNPTTDRTLKLPSDGDGTILTTNSSVGKAIQIVTNTQESITSIASASYVDIAGLNATINNVSSGTTIMIDINLLCGKDHDTGYIFKLFRDSTFLPSHSGGSNTFGMYGGDSSNYTYTFEMISYKFFDTHGQSAGSNLTYKLQGATGGSSSTVWFNRRNYDAAQRGQCRITLTEIAP